MMIDNATLRQFMNKAFSDEDLDALCFDYFPEAEADFSSGMSKSRKVIALIGHCERRGRLNDLHSAVARERTELWNQTFASQPVVETPRREVSMSSVERDSRQIFLSHATADAEFARMLARDLQAEGWRVWIAPDSIRPGEKWVEAIDRGLETSGVFIVVLTPAAIASRWVNTETDAAVEMQHEGVITFIPLNVIECLPKRLWRQYQHISFRGSYEVGLDALLRRLDGRPAPVSPALPPVDEPPVAPLPADLLAELLSGEGVRLRNAVSLLDNRKPDGPTRRALREYMKQMLAVPTTSPVERTRAGDALAELGDDRPGVLTCDGMQLCYVPPGDFWMADKQASREGHTLSFLDKPYWLAQYPATVAQFREFVQSNPDYKPAYGDRPLSSPDNRPVVYVNWYDALAFCEWLNRRWQAHLPPGYRVTLPNEAEWEKAARGGLVIPVEPHVVTVDSLKATLAGLPDTKSNPLSNREYPWGDEPEKPGTTGDPYRANSKAAGVGRPTAVGNFPKGAGPSGCLDMSGNVWEWTRSYYGKEGPYRLSAEYETIDSRNQKRMLLCGGSYWNDYTGCSARSRYYPHGYFYDNLGFRVAVSPFVSDR
ncbi:MAG: SUMF1/EgtB/PvdO family nonheme iron enzyme [Candidatus Promineofilum sp.]|nr:SUMF1/EgtB/PvdO family nonheme iron enzyme [Promineifilum sp.]